MQTLIGGAGFIAIAVFLVALPVLLLVALRKELKEDAPLRKAVHLGFAFMGLLALLMLLAAYFAGI